MYQRQVFNRYLTEAEEKQLFNHVKQFRADALAYRDYHWMQLLRYSGMRIGNLARFRVKDALRILSHPKNHGTLRDSDSKNGKGYTIKFTAEACKALRALIRSRKLMGYDPDPLAPLVMSRQKGAALSVRSYQARMHHWVMDAGLDISATPHWFRHTLAKRLLNKTTHASPLQVVQHALGHSRVQSTEVYTVPDREDIDQAMEAANQ